MPDFLKQAKEINSKNPYSIYNNIEVAKAERDFAELYLDIDEKFLNLYGTLHGGVYFLLADCCVGCAARTDGKSHVTQQASVSYIRPVKSGRVTATANVVHRGHTTSIIDVSIMDEKKRLLFKGTFTDFCVKDSIS